MFTIYLYTYIYFYQAVNLYKYIHTSILSTYADGKFQVAHT